jgi:uncharacterized protein (DUF885 family)
MPSLIFALVVGSQPLQEPESYSVMRPLVERYSADLNAIGRIHPIRESDLHYDNFKDFYLNWQDRIKSIPPGSLELQDQVDFNLLNTELDYRLAKLEWDVKRQEEASVLLPFSQQIIRLEEDRRRVETIEPKAAAEALNALSKSIDKAKINLQDLVKQDGADSIAAEPVGRRAVRSLRGLKRTLSDWYGHYDGYHPMFSWWCARPYEDAVKNLDSYTSWVDKTFTGEDSSAPEAIVGDPIGREGLQMDLDHEMIPWSPDELIEMGWEQFKWCENEMLKASRELGYGDDWKAALEHVKMQHVEPGKQTEVIRDLAHEAIAFLEENDLVTIDPLCKELWRIEMMSPQRQLITPFFTGGEVISVSYPVDSMTHDQKLMTMRGNNIHFSKATVHHELIPGHHLQGYMTSRYATHRRAFSTPFWGEGWALYWEFVLYDKGFAATPEDRIGFMWWRMHRAARIIFSLSFHLDKMTAPEAVEFLVERVGHEQSTAEGEVRRSFGGMYSPLYQAAYMVGGLQIWELRKEFVDSGKMTEKQFHDTILKNGRIPIEMVRMILEG